MLGYCLFIDPVRANGPRLKLARRGLCGGVLIISLRHYVYMIISSWNALQVASYRWFPSKPGPHPIPQQEDSRIYLTCKIISKDEEFFFLPRQLLNVSHNLWVRLDSIRQELRVSYLIGRFYLRTFPRHSGRRGIFFPMQTYMQPLRAPQYQYQKSDQSTVNLKLLCIY